MRMERTYVDFVDQDALASCNKGLNKESRCKLLQNSIMINKTFSPNPLTESLKGYLNGINNRYLLPKHI